MVRAIVGLGAFLGIAAAWGTGAWNPETMTDGNQFLGEEGDHLYSAVCQGCHMQEGRGAVGAAAYPSLFKDAALGSGTYVSSMILKGRQGMPPFGDYLSDGQVAAIANYVRSHFGNDYRDAITARDVNAVRGKSAGRPSE